jgi:hypothetical protein
MDEATARSGTTREQAISSSPPRPSSSPSSTPAKKREQFRVNRFGDLFSQ